MKKVTGILFIATAVVLLSSSFKPMAEEVPRITKVVEPIVNYAEEVPRITKLDEPVINFAEEVPRIVFSESDEELPRLI